MPSLARFLVALALLTACAISIAPLSGDDSTPIAPAFTPPAGTPVATPPPGVPIDKWLANMASQIPGKRKEYHDAVAYRDEKAGTLLPGAKTYFDLPYVDHPATGIFPASNQTLDLYVPAGDGPFPLIVFIHGGAWKGGDKARRGLDVAQAFVPLGFAVALVDYRFVFDAAFPGMFQDGIDAVAFLRARAADYHLDAGRIGIMGESAGCHIASVVGLAEGESNSAYAHIG
ncbi:MAG TPA: alpha/beta hydrolase, partial [Candidatus Methylacidiphilales bacterium]|nr:alpha/beta hydrolase [Candidatus Methylacidiphilales bacterium]